METIFKQLNEAKEDKTPQMALSEYLVDEGIADEIEDVQFDDYEAKKDWDDLENGIIFNIGRTEYLAFEDEEDAEEYAKEGTRQLFDEGGLSYFNIDSSVLVYNEIAYVTDTDKRVIANEESDFIVGDMDIDEVAQELKRESELIDYDETEEYDEINEEYQTKYDEIEEKLQETNDPNESKSLSKQLDEINNEWENELEAFEKAYNDDMERLKISMQEELMGKYYDEIYEELDEDPIEWYRNLTGDEELPDFIRVDEDKLADYIFDIDGMLLNGELVADSSWYVFIR